MAVVYMNDGLVHNINLRAPDAVWVDYATPNTQTTVNVLSGGNATELDGFNRSQLNVAGGLVQNLYSYDSANVNILSGTVPYLVAYNNSNVTISSGEVYNLYSRDESQGLINGGAISRWMINGNSHFTMAGGSLMTLFLYGNSQITTTGGSFLTYNQDFSRIFENATWIIRGSNFAIDGQAVDFGEIRSLLGGSCGNEPYSRVLTGVFENGDQFTNRFRIGDSASIILAPVIPEPMTLSLFCLSSLILMRRKR
jgi:hypothetical protein